MALNLAISQQAGDVGTIDRWRGLLHGGLKWLAEHQNNDGGWGDTVLSISNISTSMLANAVLISTRPLHFGQQALMLEDAIGRSDGYINKMGGVDAVLKRYGKDHTFSVPILTHCALAGIVDWNRVIPLPFELARVPARFYAAVRMPVVSYALPALIAIGQVIFKHRGHWNPVIAAIRRSSIKPTLKVLETIQPPNGGFLEATPLTSFVCMSLLGCGLLDHVVTQRCLLFIESSVREDGSWPIDTNLTTWVTTLSVNALAESAESAESAQSAETAPAIAPPVMQDRCIQLSPSERDVIREWLLNQQYKTIHPYTNAAPGGWSWTDLPGGVPDADDTPGAMLAVMNLRKSNEAFTNAESTALRNAAIWLLDLQNRDGGWPTFCRGWGTLPFDRSSCDLTAHAMRALRMWLDRFCGNQESFEQISLRKRVEKSIDRGLRFIIQQQRANGTWLPLWFGHQFNSDDENPLYGTAKVLLALTDVRFSSFELRNAAQQSARRAVLWLIENQNDDGGWSAKKGLDSSVEETGLAVEALTCDTFREIHGIEIAVNQGAAWLFMRVNEGTVQRASPIGFYFAKLWYFEALYPTIFAAVGLIKWQRWSEKKAAIPENAVG